MKPIHYSMIIEWSDEDQTFIVAVPELQGCKTHGDTYQQALDNALAAVDLWIEVALRKGRPIPAPKIAA